MHDVLRETESLAAIFGQLQTLLLQHIQPEAGRTAMVSADQLVIMLTGCVVVVFSELEAEMDCLETVDKKAGWWDRVKWAQKQDSLRSIMERLAVHKMSLNLMLTVLLCQSSSHAEITMKELHTEVQKLVLMNARLLALIEGAKSDDEGVATPSLLPEGFACASTTPISILASNPASFQPDFEEVLTQTRVYLRAARCMETSSFLSLHTSETRWSQLSGLSLAQISDISVILLPIHLSELPRGAVRCFAVSSMDTKRFRDPYDGNAEDDRGTGIIPRTVYGSCGRTTLNKSRAKGEIFLYMAGPWGSWRSYLRLLNYDSGANYVTYSTGDGSALVIRIIDTSSQSNHNALCVECIYRTELFLLVYHTDGDAAAEWDSTVERISIINEVKASGNKSKNNSYTIVIFQDRYGKDEKDCDAHEWVHRRWTKSRTYEC
ncbi:hypothetical protein K440DRAFT_658538 [Wilcoxina mikolae CBS 423.85]|nr:hypothetical protein K440DRAFT_658538 [Wilcoxina mikolae CBS 423.85]